VELQAEHTLAVRERLALSSGDARQVHRSGGEIEGVAV